MAEGSHEGDAVLTGAFFSLPPSVDLSRGVCGGIVVCPLLRLFT